MPRLTGDTSLGNAGVVDVHRELDMLAYSQYRYYPHLCIDVMD